MTGLRRPRLAFLGAIAASALVLAGQRSGSRAAAAELALARAERDTARVRERRALGLRAQAETVHTRDTIRLTLTRRRTDTLLRTLRDTLVHVDTVRVLLQAERRSCDAVIGSSEMRLSACDSTAAALRSQLAAADRIAGLTRRRWSDRLGVYGGYGVSASPGGEIRHGAQLGAGIRLWPP